MQNDLGMFRPPQKTHNLSQYNFNGSKEGRFVVLLQEKKIDEPLQTLHLFSKMHLGLVALLNKMF